MAKKKVKKFKDFIKDLVLITPEQIDNLGRWMEILMIQIGWIVICSTIKLLIRTMDSMFLGTRSNITSMPLIPWNILLPSNYLVASLSSVSYTRMIMTTFYKWFPELCPS